MFQTWLFSMMSRYNQTASYALKLVVSLCCTQRLSIQQKAQLKPTMNGFQIPETSVWEHFSNRRQYCHIQIPSRFKAQAPTTSTLFISLKVAPSSRKYFVIMHLTIFGCHQPRHKLNTQFSQSIFPGTQLTSLFGFPC